MFESAVHEFLAYQLGEEEVRSAQGLLFFVADAIRSAVLLPLPALIAPRMTAGRRIVPAIPRGGSSGSQGARQPRGLDVSSAADVASICAIASGAARVRAHGGDDISIRAIDGAGWLVLMRGPSRPEPPRVPA